MEPKTSKGNGLLVVCVLGAVATYLDWSTHSKGKAAIDIAFFAVVLLAMLCLKWMKPKPSKTTAVLIVCIGGTLDTCFAWFQQSKGWVGIDIIFWTFLLFVVLRSKETA
jgi:hypothetical protein